MEIDLCWKCPEVCFQVLILAHSLGVLHCLASLPDALLDAVFIRWHSIVNGLADNSTVFRDNEVAYGRRCAFILLRNTANKSIYKARNTIKNSTPYSLAPSHQERTNSSSRPTHQTLPTSPAPKSSVSLSSS